MLTLVLWQRVVFLCASSTLFRVSLVMFVRRMLCSVRLNVLIYIFNKERCTIPEDDRVIETCTNVLMYILDFLNNMYMCMCWCV